MAQEIRKTPYNEIHHSHGARMVAFAGWEMPVHFAQGIVHEHLKVRRAAGLFDVAHMGRIHFRGAGAGEFVNYLITNDLGRIGKGQLLYTALCNHEGGIIDDVTVYHMGDWVLLVANAANADAVWDWAQGLKPAGVEMENVTNQLAQIALQGPQAEALLRSPFSEAVADLGYYHHTTLVWNGEEILISRNGYTGEDGFEIYAPAAAAVPLWETLMEWGRDAGLEAVGLGARDSLRLEVNYALYGNELSTETTPLEAGLRWVVKLKKGDFIGRDALLKHKKEGLKRTLVGFEVAGRRLPRHGYVIRCGGDEVGLVTSGGYCPALEKGMGMGYVPREFAAIGTEIEIDARGARLSARVVERPFYKEGSVRR
jgi:aminomethyltransferase